MRRNESSTDLSKTVGEKPAVKAWANDTQVGGLHYKLDGVTQEHWDYAWEHGYDSFQYVITKYIERHKRKHGLEDLRKARHYLDKYIEIMEAEEAKKVAAQAA